MKSQQDPTPVRKLIAIHEAGHAVVARVLDQKFKHVMIGREDGVKQMRSAAHAARKSSIVTRIAGHEIDAKIALAGCIATRMSRHPSDRAAQTLKSHKLFELKAQDDEFEGDYSRVCHAVQAIALLTAGKPLPEPNTTLDDAVLESAERTLERLKRETKAILKDHWSAVKRVAKALFDRGRLSQEEVDRLISNCSARPVVRLTRI